MINKRKLNFNKYSTFQTKKLSANSANTAYTEGYGGRLMIGTPDIMWLTICFIKDELKVWTGGLIYNCGNEDLSNLITKEEFDPINESYQNHIVKGTLSTINGQSLESGDNITLDMSLYKIVSELPTENILENKIYIIASPKANNETEFSEYLWTGSKWDQLGVYSLKVDLSDYLKTTDADKKYMSLLNGTGTMSINPNNGQMTNYGPNGQAFTAVRDCTSGTLTGKAINGGAFGVKMDGTTAFSHKTYDTFDVSTGKYTGARNTSVLSFSAETGLRYAKNTGTTADVTEAMYKYVGVIDSPDENLKVYSAKLVDALLSPLQLKITELENEIKLLKS